MSALNDAAKNIDIAVTSKIAKIWDGLTAYGNGTRQGADDYPDYITDASYQSILEQVFDTIKTASTYTTREDKTKPIHEQELKRSIFEDTWGANMQKLNEILKRETSVDKQYALDILERDKHKYFTPLQVQDQNENNLAGEKKNDIDQKEQKKGDQYNDVIMKHIVEDEVDFKPMEKGPELEGYIKKIWGIINVLENDDEGIVKKEENAGILKERVNAYYGGLNSLSDVQKQQQATLLQLISEATEDSYKEAIGVTQLDREVNSDLITGGNQFDERMTHHYGQMKLTNKEMGAFQKSLTFKILGDTVDQAKLYRAGKRVEDPSLLTKHNLIELIHDGKIVKQQYDALNAVGVFMDTVENQQKGSSQVIQHSDVFNDSQLLGTLYKSKKELKNTILDLNRNLVEYDQTRINEGGLTKEQQGLYDDTLALIKLSDIHKEVLTKEIDANVSKLAKTLGFGQHYVDEVKGRQAYKSKKAKLDYNQDDLARSDAYIKAMKEIFMKQFKQELQQQTDQEINRKVSDHQTLFPGGLPVSKAPFKQQAQSLLAKLTGADIIMDEQLEVKEKQDDNKVVALAEIVPSSIATSVVKFVSEIKSVGTKRRRLPEDEEEEKDYIVPLDNRKKRLKKNEYSTVFKKTATAAAVAPLQNDLVIKQAEMLDLNNMVTKFADSIADVLPENMLIIPSEKAQLQRENTIKLNVALDNKKEEEKKNPPSQQQLQQNANDVDNIPKLDSTTKQKQVEEQEIEVIESNADMYTSSIANKRNDMKEQLKDLVQDPIRTGAGIRGNIHRAKDDIKKTRAISKIRDDVAVRESMLAKQKAKTLKMKEWQARDDEYQLILQRERDAIAHMEALHQQQQLVLAEQAARREQDFKEQEAIYQKDLSGQLEGKAIEDAYKQLRMRELERDKEFNLQMQQDRQQQRQKEDDERLAKAAEEAAADKLEQQRNFKPYKVGGEITDLLSQTGNPKPLIHVIHEGKQQQREANNYERKNFISAAPDKYKILSGEEIKKARRGEYDNVYIAYNRSLKQMIMVDIPRASQEYGSQFKNLSEQQKEEQKVEAENDMKELESRENDLREEQVQLERAKELSLEEEKKEFTSVTKSIEQLKSLKESQVAVKQKLVEANKIMKLDDKMLKISQKITADQQRLLNLPEVKAKQHQQQQQSLTRGAIGKQIDSFVSTEQRQALEEKERQVAREEANLAKLKNETLLKTREAELNAIKMKQKQEVQNQEEVKSKYDKKTADDEAKMAYKIKKNIHVAEMKKYQMLLNGVEANIDFKEAKENPIIKQLLDERSDQSKEVKTLMTQIEKDQKIYKELADKQSNKVRDYSDDLQNITNKYNAAQRDLHAQTVTQTYLDSVNKLNSDHRLLVQENAALQAKQDSHFANNQNKLMKKELELYEWQNQKKYENFQKSNNDMKTHTEAMLKQEIAAKVASNTQVSAFTTADLKLKLNSELAHLQRQLRHDINEQRRQNAFERDLKNQQRISDEAMQTGKNVSNEAIGGAKNTANLSVADKAAAAKTTSATTQANGMLAVQKEKNTGKQEEYKQKLKEDLDFSVKKLQQDLVNQEAVNNIRDMQLHYEAQDRFRQLVQERDVNNNIQATADSKLYLQTLTRDAAYFQGKEEYAGNVMQRAREYEKKALIDVDLDLINPEKHNNRDLYNITQYQGNPVLYLRTKEQRQLVGDELSKFESIANDKAKTDKELLKDQRLAAAMFGNAIDLLRYEDPGLGDENSDPPSQDTQDKVLDALENSAAVLYGQTVLAFGKLERIPANQILMLGNYTKTVQWLIDKALVQGEGRSDVYISKPILALREKMIRIHDGALVHNANYDAYTKTLIAKTKVAIGQQAAAEAEEVKNDERAYKKLVMKQEQSNEIEQIIQRLGLSGKEPDNGVRGVGGGGGSGYNRGYYNSSRSGQYSGHMGKMRYIQR